MTENPTPNQIEHAIALRMAGEKLPAPCDADSKLAKIILKACAYDPDARYASAQDMLTDIERYLQTEKIKLSQNTRSGYPLINDEATVLLPQTDSVTQTIDGYGIKQNNRNKILLKVISAAAVVLCVVLIYFSGVFVPKYDPFDGVKVVFSGSGTEIAATVKETKDHGDLEYRLDKMSGLSSGDTVTLYVVCEDAIISDSASEFTYDRDIVSAYCEETFGAKPSSLVAECTVP